MEWLLYIVVFLFFWTRLVEAAPLAVHCPTKLYAPCGIVQQSNGMDSEASSQSELPEAGVTGRVSSNSVDCESDIRCPCSVLEKASPDLQYMQNDIDHSHADENIVVCETTNPKSEDDKGNVRFYCSCAPVLSSSECYSLALPVLVMMALGLVVHSTLKSSREDSNGHKNDGSNCTTMSNSGLEKNGMGIVVFSDVQDQDVESFDDSDFPMG